MLETSPTLDHTRAYLRAHAARGEALRAILAFLRPPSARHRR